MVSIMLRVLKALGNVMYDTSVASRTVRHFLSIRPLHPSIAKVRGYTSGGRNMIRIKKNDRTETTAHKSQLLAKVGGEHTLYTEE